MSLGHGVTIVKDGLVFAYDMGSKQSWKGKPVENLVAAGQRTCSSSLTRMSAHVQAYTYQSGVSYGNRKDVIKATITPTTTNPYADYGFQVSRSGGSRVGDVYWVSFEYLNVKGGSDPSGVSTYANGYKNPDSGSAGTLSDTSVVELPDGWKRWSGKVTITRAGNTWWRFGQNSNSEEVEFYLDNFQIIYSDVDAPFVDGTRSNTESIIDWAGGNIITANSLTYNSDNTFSFDGSSDSINIDSLADTDFGSTFTLECWFNQKTANNPGPLIEKYYWAVANKGGWGLRFKGGNIQFFTNNNTSASSFFAGTSLSTNTYYHVVMSLSGDNVSMYINGSLVNTGSVTAAATSIGMPVYIGERGDNSGAYNNVDIPIAKIYNKALSGQEVKQNFNALRGRFGI